MAKKTYSVAEARAKLPSILNEVGAGDEVYLTRRGQPAAVVLSTKTYDALRAGRTTFASAYRDFQRRRAADDLNLNKAYFDSLRDPSPGRRVRL